jgi:hypothetical protein
MTLEELIDERDIRRVLYLYCRGVDRRDFELVRSCFHADGHTDYGTFTGSVDRFVDYVRGEMDRFDRSTHSLANIIIDLDGPRAVAETYVTAFHRLPQRTGKPTRDFVCGLRYIDRLDKRDGRWALSDRHLAFEWGRLDIVTAGTEFDPNVTMGKRWPDDLIYASQPA